MSFLQQLVSGLYLYPSINSLQSLLNDFFLPEPEIKEFFYHKKQEKIKANLNQNYATIFRKNESRATIQKNRKER